VFLLNSRRQWFIEPMSEYYNSTRAPALLLPKLQSQLVKFLQQFLLVRLGILYTCSPESD